MERGIGQGTQETVPHGTQKLQASVFSVKNRLGLGTFCLWLLGVVLSACPSSCGSGENRSGEDTVGDGHLTLEITPTSTIRLSPIETATFDIQVSGFSKNDASKEGMGILNIVLDKGLWFNVEDKSPAGTSKVFALTLVYDGTAAFPGGQAALGIELKNLPKGYRYSGGLKTTSIAVIDGNERNRAIPLNQSNIQAFNYYVTNSAFMSLGQHYKLTENIELEPPASPTTSNWTPIGVEFQAFAGSFEGGGHTVSGLYIYAPDKSYLENNYQGFFGHIDHNAVIENLGLLDVHVTGVDHVGGLVGGNRGGTLRNCHVSGKVSGNHYVGGLAGYSDGTLQNSYASVDVEGEGNYVGGLAGQNFNVLVNSYATGNVEGKGNNIGGLVGFAGYGSMIQNSYATGSVSGNHYVGGITGAHPEFFGVAGFVSTENCMALNPSVSGKSNVGRVSGNDLPASFGSSLLSGNYAFADMLNSSGTTVWNNPGQNHLDGQPIRAAELGNGSFPAAFTLPPWTYQVGSLPGLGNPVPMPSHL